jgi:hypothetical protein
MELYGTYVWNQLDSNKEAEAWVLINDTTQAILGTKTVVAMITRQKNRRW